MGKRKPTRREVFLQLMERVIPWDLLLKAIEPYYPKAGPQGDDRPILLRSCCEFIFCRTGMGRRTDRWKKPCMRMRYCVDFT